MADVSFKTRVKGGFPVLVEAWFCKDHYGRTEVYDLVVNTLKGKSADWLNLSKRELSDLETEALEALDKEGRDSEEDAAADRADYLYQVSRDARLEARF